MVSNSVIRNARFVLVGTRQTTDISKTYLVLLLILKEFYDFLVSKSRLFSTFIDISSSHYYGVLLEYKFVYFEGLFNFEMVRNLFLLSVLKFVEIIECYRHH